MQPLTKKNNFGFLKIIIEFDYDKHELSYKINNISLSSLTINTRFIVFETIT